MGIYDLIGLNFQLEIVEKVLEMDGGEGFTTV